MSESPLTITECDTCLSMFQSSAQPGEDCMHCGCTGQLRTLTKQQERSFMRRKRSRPPSDEKIVGVISHIMPTSHWLLIWPSHDGKLRSISPTKTRPWKMRVECTHTTTLKTSDGFMWCVFCGCLESPDTKQWRPPEALMFEYVERIMRKRTECTHQREIAPLLCGYEWCADCGAVKHVSDDEWRTPGGLTP